LRFAVLLLPAVLVGCGSPAPTPDREADEIVPPASAPAFPAGGGFPYGIAVAEVSATSAVLWAGPGRPGRVVFEVVTAGRRGKGEAGGKEGRIEGNALQVEVETDPEADHTASATISSLTSGTRYRVTARFAGQDGSVAVEEGSFSTAPGPTARAAVTFLVGGDLGGHSYCRHREHGYRIFDAMARREADFFLANGDLIYADGVCPEQGPDGWRNVAGSFPSVADPRVDWTDRETVAEIYFAHWRYNRADRHYRHLLARTPIYAQWDDHEVINDSGHTWESWPRDPNRPGWRNLVRQGRRAFFAYHPLPAVGRRARAAEPDGSDPRTYRRYRWGAELEVFLLDGRSYRSPNRRPDTPENEKTLLGQAQLEWLVEGLTTSEATWKVVSSNVPLALPSGYFPILYGQDSFASGSVPGVRGPTGFERELLSLLTALDAADVTGLVVVATDAHLAMSLAHAVDADGDGDSLGFLELISGPLNAGPASELPTLDDTLDPQILYQETGFFNFLELRVQVGQGVPGKDESTLVAEIRDESGAVRPGSRLERRISRPVSRP